MEKIAICRFYLLNKLILNILKISLVVYMGIENKDKKETRHPPGKGEELLLNTKKKKMLSLLLFVGNWPLGFLVGQVKREIQAVSDIRKRDIRFRRNHMLA